MSMRGREGSRLSDSDGIPYGSIYALLHAWCEGDEPRAAEPPALQWGRPALVRLFKRLGTVPAGHSARQAALRVLIAATEMAESADVAVETVFADLLRLCDPCDAEPDPVCGERPRCGECPIRAHCAHAQRRPGLKELPPSERPRERLLAGGDRAVSDAELVAILLGGGSRDEHALALAQRLLARFGGLRRLADAGAGELEAIKGIGKAKVARLRAAFAVGRRIAAHPMPAGRIIKASRQVFDHFREQLKDMKREVFLCVLLDTKHRIIRENEISVGLLNESLVHPREAFNAAIRESAAAVIFVHNHPSGDPTPSQQDRRLTRRLWEAGNVTGIRVLDHVVIGRDTYYSFSEHKELESQGMSHASEEKSR